MAEEARKKEAKINQRTAKAALTRCGKTVNNFLSGNRPESEVKESLAKYQESFGRLVELHEQYVKLIEDDNEFEKEEEWLGQCQERFMEIEYLAKVYIEDSSGRVKERKGKNKALASKNGKQDLSASTSSMNEEMVSEANSNGTIKTSGISAEVTKETGDIVTDGNDTASSTHTIAVEQADANNTDSNTSTIAVEQPEAVEIHVANSGSNAQNDVSLPQESIACNFKVEKPKLPCFNGDVREYATFKSDFKHAIERKYS